tara:strand:+ start:9131 stop:9634 length:504 start_codon:yes stop_codon:yes gene_type:complete
MASNSVTNLKGYFETGDRPTSAQFGELIETIASPYYNGLQAKTANFTAAAGYIYTVLKLDGMAIVLPTPAVGDKIKFVGLSTTSNTTTITADATSTLFNGYLLLSDGEGDRAESHFFSPDGSDDDVITLNSTTTGHHGIIELTGTATNRWFVEGAIVGSGATVTPFS